MLYMVQIASGGLSLGDCRTTPRYDRGKVLLLICHSIRSGQSRSLSAVWSRRMARKLAGTLGLESIAETSRRVPPGRGTLAFLTESHLSMDYWPESRAVVVCIHSCVWFPTSRAIAFCNSTWKPEQIEDYEIVPTSEQMARRGRHGGVM